MHDKKEPGENLVSNVIESFDLRFIWTKPWQTSFLDFHRISTMPTLRLFLTSEEKVRQKI